MAVRLLHVCVSVCVRLLSFDELCAISHISHIQFSQYHRFYACHHGGSRCQDEASTVVLQNENVLVALFQEDAVRVLIVDRQKRTPTLFASLSSYAQARVLSQGCLIGAMSGSQLAGKLFLRAVQYHKQ